MEKEEIGTRDLLMLIVGGIIVVFFWKFIITTFTPKEIAAGLTGIIAIILICIFFPFKKRKLPAKEIKLKL